MKKIASLLCLVMLITGCKEKKEANLSIEKTELTAIQIMEKAHENAGGDFWKRPKSLTMKGYGIFYEDVGTLNRI